MRYVQHHKEVESKIQSDVRYLVFRLREELGSEIVSILLCGGYGRGEGSVIFQDGAYRPYNDYDLLLVTRSRISPSALQSLSRLLAKEVDIRFVDLSAVTLSQISSMPHSVFTYDLSVSQLLYGLDVRSRLPIIDPIDFSIAESQKLMGNRLICFFELTPANFFQGKPLTDDQRRPMALQVSKAVIAAHQADLVARNIYVSSYKEQSCVTDSSLVQLAYAVKLGQYDPVDLDIQRFWLEARLYYLQQLERFGVTQPLSFFQRFSCALRWLVKRYVYNEATESILKKIQIEEVVWSLLKVYSEKVQCVDSNPLLLLRRYFDISIKGDDWDELISVCNRLWSRYHH